MRKRYDDSVASCHAGGRLVIALLSLHFATCFYDFDSRRVMQPSHPVVSLACGNGQAEPPEACDDGNTVSEDGCSSACAVEQGWSCGDGLVRGSEHCDDANVAPLDGCSSACV